MSSNFAPVAGNIVVVDGFTSVKKYPLPSTPRSFPAGAPLYNNGAGGVEPALTQAGDGTSVDHANGVFAPLFAGFALEARVPQQDNGIAAFAAQGGTTPALEDASRGFLSVADEGIAIGPCDALAAQQEIGAAVQIAGFQNEAGTGFYDSTGTLRKDTNYYLYNNKVQIAETYASVATDPGGTIGILCERALAGATVLKFKFKSAVLSPASVL